MAPKTNGSFSKQVKLGIAPLTWTNDDLPSLGGHIPFEQCLSEMALAGFEGCEVGVKFPKKNLKKLQHELALRQLQICNQWFSYEFTTKKFSEVKRKFLSHLKFLKAMGATVVGGAEQGRSIQGQQSVPVFSGRPRFSESDWQKVSSGLNALGKIAQEEGLSLCYHHHMGTGIEDREEMDRLLAETDERYVFVNYDSGHFYYAGEDPLAMLKRYLPRTRHIHLKNIRRKVLARVKKNDLSFLESVRQGVFTVPGDPAGCLDFPPLFRVLKQRGYAGWLVVEAEQDPAKAPPLEYALMTRNYLRNILKR